MTRYPTTPPPRAEWVRAGDRCVQPLSGWRGTVVRVIETASLPYARVRWDHNGHTGPVTITTIRRYEED